jgi:serine/threonine-protein kinase HipA
VIVHVFADWSGDRAPMPFGTLESQRGRSGETFDFRFDPAMLASPNAQRYMLDPDLAMFAGRQYPGNRRTRFGIFADSSPDRWGRTLIRRRFEREKRLGQRAASERIAEHDYLLGVHDAFRSGALRYKTDPPGPFLDDGGAAAAPPFVRLRELEAASRVIEQDPDDENAMADESLLLLLAPGASLGGARPKASVVDPNDNLWIAKFPSVGDRYDVGGWEFVVYTLAERCGLRVAPCDARRFASEAHTFMVRRFDRGLSGERIHFASAMTLTGHTDGDGAASGVSYLEIAEILMSHGAEPKADLRELWSRICFNVLVSNTDDHLRNHGFLLDPRGGWRLSEAYDMNPVPRSSGLALNVDESDNARDLELVLSVAPYFRLSHAEATAIVATMSRVVTQWRSIATALGIKRRDHDDMADAFVLAS